jgi:cell division protein ZapA
MITEVISVNDERSKDKDNSSAMSIRVEIYNQTYSIRSFDGDSEYIMQLAEYVNGKMNEISSKSLTVDSLKVAILAALQIADDLHRLKSLHEKADGELASRSAECAEMLDRVLKVKSTEEQSEEQESSLTQQNAS